ncbi:hypothetical protein A2774_04445 [Candidatus Roizmanbacteria bacterium RIFCSPHIGHO2_01_FULL_39_12c]|uniref:LTD domain-containing protein n=1 Tax=Candidatus Roizmanbacteria bacterium RIFCSPHIGHO2_01_FULL_39_12c TaxID=1802031 RepID=A0A1F7G9E7_9BACT|nr:MAG: hypothetical protein A2774_04445 [Candidatus Roizmanbacteria bacterium RIFCSPHIGHO2_01_FULL_39_12c]
MKKRIMRIIILLLLITAILNLKNGTGELFKSSTVMAVGDLLVDFHRPPGTPMFDLDSMKPGDSEDHNVDVINDGALPRFIAIRGIKTEGTTILPLLENILIIQIAENSNILYGPNSLKSFLNDSADADGVAIQLLSAGEHKTYNIKIDFPQSADNNYQGKSVKINFSFGEITGQNVVINEVFYNPKKDFFLGFLLDRLDKDRFEDEYMNIDKRRLFRRQWIELYNPTDQDILLKNWSLTDNSGKKISIHFNKKIKAHGFVLISKSSFLWWLTIPWKGNFIPIGRFFGDGFDVDGDRLMLKDSEGIEVDRMSWGSDASGFDPPGVNPKVDKGHSTERLAPGFDTDSSSDWTDRSSPSPGQK